MSFSKLFQPLQIGDLLLSHRIVLCPLTRVRATSEYVPGKAAAEYYSQRASTPGTLLITEGTFISPDAVGLWNTPGIWSDEQVKAWTEVVDAVHAKGSFVYLQLWAMGRGAIPQQLVAGDGVSPYVSSSDVPLAKDGLAPRPLTHEEIQEYVQAYVVAASNAVHGAGFDGVEIHAANGYLIDQFTQDVTNQRTDEYGGSIENRCRFALEILHAVSEEIGQQRTAIRFSPWSDYLGMRMTDPIPTFSYLIQEIAETFSALAYLHLVEPRIAGDQQRQPLYWENNDVFRKIWAPRPLIVAGGFTRDTAMETADSTGNLIGFGRAFISNPDLPFRLMRNIPLSKGYRAHYYVPGEQVIGYTDYPFWAPIARGLEGHITNPGNTAGVQATNRARSGSGSARFERGRRTICSLIGSEKSAVNI